MSSWEKLVRDPYLVDAMEGFSKELGTLRRVKKPEKVEQQVYLLRELARDAMMRLIPFSEHMRPVIQEAQRQCKNVLQVLEGKTTNANIAQYSSHIETRVQEYAAFLGFA